MATWHSSEPGFEHAGLAMLLSALLNQYKNISDVELGTWAKIADMKTSNCQEAKLCKSCMEEFCAATTFTENPDIEGIGVRFEPPVLVIDLPSNLELSRS
jgi:hypothetical protein